MTTIVQGGILVSPTVGHAAMQQPGFVVAGMPGFGQGPIYTFDGGPHVGWITYSFGAAPSTAPIESTSTGVAPTETSYALYGHIIPLSLGRVRIGGDIIAGPWVENGKASFCISFGVPADPADTRTLKEIAFDSEVVWENGAFNTESFTFRYYPGTLTQAADPLEIAHFGVNAVAYRPQILLWFENLLISNTKFQKIPYVAAVIEDSSLGEVNLGWAFQQLAYSPWVGYSSAEFETIGVTDGVTNGGIIIAQDAEFLSTIQQFGRFYRNWNILQTDKLRIVDRGAAVTPDIVLNKTKLMNSIVFARGEQSSTPRVLELSTIDPDADYTIVPSTASRPREPVNVSASVSTEAVYLPLVMDTHTRQSLVTYTKYQEEVARKKITGTAMMYGVQIEPGDLVGIGGLGSNFEDDTYKVVETLHGANYTVEFAAEAFLKCGMPGDPYWIYVVLLLGFEDVDGSKGSPGLDDESLKHHPTAVSPNNTQVDTSQSKFGSSSLWVTGASPSIILDYSDDWGLAATNTDEYTIEVWARFNSIYPSTNVMIASSFLNVTWNFSVSSTGELIFGFRPLSGGTSGPAVTTTSTGAGLTINTWYHLAVDKDSSGKLRLYRNGVMVGSAMLVESATYHSVSDGLDIGAAGLGGAFPIDGWLDEIRITKGIARYKSDGGFAIPTAAYPRGAPL